MPAFRRPVLAPAAFLLLLCSGWAGWSFDTNLGPEAARDLFVVPEVPAPPAGSWLRIRDMDGSNVHGQPRAEKTPSIEERRNALRALRNRGYRLVAMIGWSSGSSAGGVRPGQPLRRLPLDLRDAATHCRQLAETYGDLIDWWEIIGEPDISFIEENPETYAAFLKACYLGIKQAALEAQKQSPAVSSVLMAAFALPPGPYFNAWVANDGLRYTDGFNYHFYGYAEDFTGVYRQFEAAVAQASEPTPSAESVFSTQFYPSRTGWRSQVLSRFAPEEGDVSLNREILQARPLGTHEPSLEPQGRWLVSPGTAVRETGDTWEFTVTQPSPGPMRPAMAELPLPAGWSIRGNSRLAFEYRIAKPADVSRESDDRSPAEAKARTPSTINRRSSGIKYPSSTVSPPLPAVSVRKLPVFVTEYGYGLLDGEARKTAGGREAQRAWFESTEHQARQLGVAHALAFNFQPDHTALLGEFGLLMNKESSPPEPANAASATSHFKGFTVSPALALLLKAGSQPIEPRDWTVAANPPAPVVIDFVADRRLEMTKAGCGYFLPAEPNPVAMDVSASNRLVLYNFATEPVAGELSLDGAWMLASEKRSAFLQLRAGERREIPIVVGLAPTDRYAPQRATARFRRKSALEREPQAATQQKPADGGETTTVVSPTPSPVAQPAPPVPAGAEFEAYIRTQSGNLYQTWPRLQARADWRWYVEPFTSFTPAFFGRAHLPSSLAENVPAALVFFFRPGRYPVTYQLRHASAVELVRRETESSPGGSR